MDDFSKALLLQLKGVISEMSEDDQKKIKECHDNIDAIVKEYGDNGFIALALIGAELQGK